MGSSTPSGGVGPVGDLTNVQMTVLDKEDRYDVVTGYALLAGAPLPAVLRADDLTE